MEKIDPNKIVAAILAASKCSGKNCDHETYLQTYDEFIDKITMRERAKLKAKRDEDAAAIGVLFREAEKGVEEIARSTITIGLKLTAKKDTMEHGEWLPWLKANEATLGFGVLRAQRIMQAPARGSKAPEVHTRNGG